MNVEKDRLVRACILVLGLIAFVFLSGFLEEGKPLHIEASSQEAPSPGLRDHALALLAEREMGQTVLPMWFSEELFFVEGAREYADARVGIFALVCEADPDELAKDVMTQMQERGWERKSDDASSYMGFSRETGQPRSVAMSFTEVAGCTTVVLQILG